MHTVEPKIYLIGRTHIIPNATQEWLNDMGANKYVMDPYATGGEQLVQLAGKRCYMSFQPGLNPNVSKVRTDMGAFIDNILSVGHGSVIEHSIYNFAIENVSRVFTGEMNRHRAGMAISEGSMRFIRFTDIPYWIPTSIREVLGDSEELKSKKAKSRKIFEKAFLQAQENYQELLDTWSLDSMGTFKDKKNITSMMRRIIPMGVASGGVWSGNLRALRHIFAMRCDEAAEEEIMLVACLMLEKMIEAEPLFFKDFYKDENGYWKPKYWKV